MSEAALHAASRANAIVVLVAVLAGISASLWLGEALTRSESALTGLAAALGVLMIGGVVISRRNREVC